MERPKRITLLGERVIAFRDSEGRIGLIAEYCAHRRASLYFGRNEESGIRCVYHGWKFDVDGRCVDMPSEPLGVRSVTGKVRLWRRTPASSVPDSCGPAWAPTASKRRRSRCRSCRGLRFRPVIDTSPAGCTLQLGASAGGQDRRGSRPVPPPTLGQRSLVA